MENRDHLLNFMGDLVDIDAAVVCFLLIVTVPALLRYTAKSKMVTTFMHLLVSTIESSNTSQPIKVVHETS